MSLAAIELLVKEKADQSGDSVFGLLFSKLKDQHIKEAHAGNCDCSYCGLLRQYAVARVRLHHLKKRFYRDDVSPADVDANFIFSSQLDYANKLRAQKNRAKLS